jgi:hypothetical protein
MNAGFPGCRSEGIQRRDFVWQAGEYTLNPVPEALRGLVGNHKAKGRAVEASARVDIEHAVMLPFEGYRRIALATGLPKGLTDNICTYNVHSNGVIVGVSAMAGAVERIVVQATAQEKKAISAKAKKLGVGISELMRRGAAAYQSSEVNEELSVLADAAKDAADRASASIDDALKFIEASNRRIAAMEANAAKAPSRKAG